jgi:hypothetical protein
MAPPQRVWPYRDYNCTLPEIEKSFYKEMASHGILFKIHKKAILVDKLSICQDDPKAIGCAIFGGRIELLRSFWDRSDCGWREALVFHEHGHADLILGHQDNTLMAPYIEDGYACMIDGRDACIKQLADRHRAVLFFFNDEKIHILQTPRLP